MCVSTGPAEFSQTILTIAKAIHPQSYRPVHVLGYQNTARSLLPFGGNAMLLHFPSRGMSRHNVIETKAFPNCLKDQVEAVRPQSRAKANFDLFGAVAAGPVEIFDSGIYTVVLAQNPEDIPRVLHRVPAEKRPNLNEQLFAWYGARFPNWSFALCCFNNSDAVDADPMLWWYDPNLHREQFMLPSIDCHTGAVPDLDRAVEVDHWVILGDRERRSPYMQEVKYSEARAMSKLARALLPKWVIGRKFVGTLPNTDFIFPVDALNTGKPDLIKRELLT